MKKEGNLNASNGLRNPDRTARVVGRGLVVITAAKLWFMVGGVAITFGLPFIFDSIDSNGRALYGQYYDLNNILSIFSMMMVTGVMQATAHFVAQRPGEARGVARQGLKMMLLLGGCIGGAIIIFSPQIALSRGNPHLTNGYRAAGLIVFAYGLYTVCIGCLNGRKEFFKQALFDLSFTTLKAILVLGFAALGMGVVGAFFGFALAATIIMGAAFILIYRNLSPGPAEPRLWSYAIQVMLYTVIFNLIFKLDGILVKPALADVLTLDSASGGSLCGLFSWIDEGGVCQNILQVHVDALMGNYGMAVAMSRLPWQATIAITFVIFPLMSEAVFAQDRVKTQSYIRQTFRYSIIVIGLAATVLTALPKVPFSFLPSGYSTGALALVWLAPAYFCFSIFNIANTLLISSGRATLALTVGAVTVTVTAGAYYFVLPSATHPLELIVTASQLTLYAFAFGLTISLGALWKVFGSPVPGGTLVRVSITATCIIVGCFWLPDLGKLGGLGALVTITLFFIFTMWVLGEFNEADRRRFKSILRKK